MVEKKPGKTKWDRLPKPSRLILSRKRVRDRKKLINVPARLAALLDTLSLRNLRVIARNHDLVLGVYRKKDVIQKIEEYLIQHDVLAGLVDDLKETEKTLLEDLLAGEGCMKYTVITQKYGDEEKDSPYWFLMHPESTLGRLRTTGIVHVGEAFYNNWLQIVVCLPDDLIRNLHSLDLQGNADGK